MQVKAYYDMKYENYDPCFPDQPVTDLYLPVWANQPAFHSKPAFIWAEDGTHELKCSSITYSQLNTCAQSVSSHLLTTLKRGDTVVILCPPGLRLVELLFGAQRAGVITVPISPPENNFHHLIRVLMQTNPKAAIAHQHYITWLKKHCASKNKQLSDLLEEIRWISVEEIDDKGSFPMNTTSLSSTYLGCTAHEVYLTQYTSGATGIPKPVLVTAGAAAHNVRAARKAYDLHPSSVIVSWLPQYHDCGLMFLLLTVVTGSTCVLTSPTAFVTRPRLWLELITKFKGTCTPVPSFTLPLVMRRGRADQGTSPINLFSLRNLIIINEPLLRSSVDNFLHEFTPLGLAPSCISPSYGLAENCTFVSTSWRRSRNHFPDIPTYKKLIPSARLTLDDNNDQEINIIVVNEETFEPVEDGAEGEIWIASQSNALGYLGHPSLTNDTFHARLRGRISQCYVRTGDRGVIRGEERYLYVMGRTSDVITAPSVGEIHPHFIESAAYKSCPGLLRGGCIAAIGVWGTIVVVAELQRSQCDDRELKRICEGIRERVLKEEKVQVGLVALVKSGGVAKTTSGKIQRWIMKQKLVRGELRLINGNDFHHDGKKMKGKEEKVNGNMTYGERDQLFLSSNISTRHTLLSFL